MLIFVFIYLRMGFCKIFCLFYAQFFLCVAYVSDRIEKKTHFEFRVHIS